MCPLGRRDFSQSPRGVYAIPDPTAARRRRRRANRSRLCAPFAGFLLTNVSPALDLPELSRLDDIFVVWTSPISAKNDAGPFVSSLLAALPN
jgi:hypothetical protein